jgi:broad specificity phosphatase PhoE
MKTYVWIRHAEKVYNNGKSYGRGSQHDSPIELNMWLEGKIHRLCDDLCEKIGVPEYVVVSPFLRTRQTAALILDYLKTKYNCTPTIEYSNDVSEYLGYCKGEYADVETETSQIYGGPIKIQENVNELDSRIENHLVSMKNKKKSTWVITHGMIISRVYTMLEGESLDRPEPLEYIVYHKNHLYTKSEMERYNKN